MCQELLDIDTSIDKMGFRSANYIVKQIINRLWIETASHQIYQDNAVQPEPLEANYKNPSNDTDPLVTNKIVVDPEMDTLMNTMMAKTEVIRLHIEGNK